MDKEKMKEMQDYFVDMQTLGEALDYIGSMDIEINDVCIRGRDISVTLGSFTYEFDIAESYNLYVVIRALYKQYDEDTDAENDILRAAVSDVLFRFLDV